MTANKKVQSFILNVDDKKNNQTIHWHHINYKSESAKDWLKKLSNVSNQAKKIVLAADTRPRLIVEDESIIMCLRGINLNVNHSPEDMISIRVWMNQNTMITSCNRQSQSILNIQNLLDKNNGPKSVSELLILLIEQLALLTDGFVDSLEDLLDNEEDLIADSTFELFNPKMSKIRRQIATIRRYLSPQKEALDKLYRSKLGFLVEGFYDNLYIQIDKFIHILENLELLKERALVLQEQFNAHISQQQNSRLYLLAIISAVFLPLTFLSGLLGMNVGGLPGMESKSAFWVVVIFCLIVTFVLLILFKKKKWY